MRKVMDIYLHPYAPNLVYDYVTGDVIDPQTGIVVDRIYVVSTGRIDFDENTPIVELEPLETETFLTRSRYAMLMDILSLVRELQERVPVAVPMNDVERECRAILSALNRPINRLQHLVAVLYIALENLGYPVSPKMLATIFGLEYEELNSVIFRFKQELHRAALTAPLSGKERMLRYLDQYVAVLRTHLGVEDRILQRVYRDAKKIIEAKGFPHKFTPRTLVAAILFIVLQNHSVAIPFSRYTKLVGVSGQLRKVIKFVKEYYFGSGEVDEHGDAAQNLVLEERGREGG